jgi:hypothetical protein
MRHSEIFEAVSWAVNDAGTSTDILKQAMITSRMHIQFQTLVFVAVFSKLYRLKLLT